MPVDLDSVAVATNSVKNLDSTVYQAQHLHFVVAKHLAVHCSVAHNSYLQSEEINTTQH